MPKQTDITEKQRAFADLILQGESKVHAYQKALNPNMSYPVAATAASRLLKNVHVSQYLAERTAAMVAQNKLDVDELVEGFRRIANANIADYLEFDAGGVYLKASRELPREALYCVEEVVERVNRDGTRTVRLKLCDKISALTKLGEYMKMFAAGATVNNNLTMNVYMPEKDTIMSTDN